MLLAMKIEMQDWYDRTMEYVRPGRAIWRPGARHKAEESTSGRGVDLLLVEARRGPLGPQITFHQ